MPAAEYAAAARAHWAVENKLHHVLDATMREDHCRARGTVAMALAVLRRAAVAALAGVSGHP